MYSDIKRTEFHEMKMGHKSVEEHVHKFMELLRYVDYIKDEKVKIQIFL